MDEDIARKFRAESEPPHREPLPIEKEFLHESPIIELNNPLTAQTSEEVNRAFATKKESKLGFFQKMYNLLTPKHGYED